MFRPTRRDRRHRKWRGDEPIGAKLSSQSVTPHRRRILQYIYTKHSKHNVTVYILKSLLSFVHLLQYLIDPMVK
ncbi:hypothetical protein FKM82_011188 [Ascaphus truei]